MNDPVVPAANSAALSASAFRHLIHEIRSPLSVISMGLEILKRTAREDDQIQAVLEMMASEGVEPIKAIIAKHSKAEESTTN